MAHTLYSHIVGLRDGDALSTTQLNINAATTHLAFCFVPMEAKTLAKVTVYVTAVTGTLGANDMVCDLRSMPGGAQASGTAPGASIESRNTVTATPTGAATVEFTGFTTALTAGQMYALVMSNANGTPASNYWTARWLTGNATQQIGSSGAWGWLKKHSTDSGSTYGTAIAAMGGVRLEFSDGTFIGTPFSNAAATASGTGVYATRELGVTFTTPADTKFRVVGIGARISATGTPTGTPRFKLYTGTTHLATTVEGGQYSTTHYLILPFATVQVLVASTVYRAVLGESTQSDAATDRFNLYEYTVFNDAGSKALMPLGGWARTYFDGSSWTDADTSAIPLWLILDATDPFDATGAGGAVVAPIFGGLVVR